MNPVVHFEMAAEDKKRMSEFYTKAFGWKTEQLGAKWENTFWLQQLIQMQMDDHKNRRNKWWFLSKN